MIQEKSIPFSFPSVFFCLSRDSHGFEPGILPGIPFVVSSEIFLKIPSGVPQFISLAILPDVSNCEISWALTDNCLLFSGFRSGLLEIFS